MRQSRSVGGAGGILGSSAEALQILQVLTAGDAHRVGLSAVPTAVTAAMDAEGGGAPNDDDDEEEEEEDDDDDGMGVDPRLAGVESPSEVRDMMARFEARAEAMGARVSAGVSDQQHRQQREDAMLAGGGREGGGGSGDRGNVIVIDDDDEDADNEYLMVKGGDAGGSDGGDGGGVGESKEEGAEAEEKGGEAVDVSMLTSPPSGLKRDGGGAKAAATAAAAAAAATSTTGAGAAGKGGEKQPDIGPGEYLLKVVYSKGATMRDGVEIDLAAVVGNLAFGTTAIATARVICSCGIPRFKTRRGWISEWLRGGMEELVVEVLHHKPVEPIRYQVICTGGAMVRETASISGPEAQGGGCKKGTIVSVAERLRLPDGTMRLRVVDPPENVGWISEKDHIVRREVRVCVCVSVSVSALSWRGLFIAVASLVVVTDFSLDNLRRLLWAIYS